MSVIDGLLPEEGKAKSDMDASRVHLRIVLS